MKASQCLFATQKDVPSDADVISNQLMVRAGFIRKLSSGIYIWLPLGLRILRTVERVVREEMSRVGAQEIVMPMVQPAHLWESTGRIHDYGRELLQFGDRHDRPFVLGPTHEEVVTTLVGNELSSYKQLPLCLFQIQNKFRDEIRPRFGVMRAREFVMKDAYSFHATQDCLEDTYNQMHTAYSRIFTRLGLDFRAVAADTGAIGGFASHEFQVLADSGEDDIVFSNISDYAANIELAPVVLSNEASKEAISIKAPICIDTPDCTSCQDVATHLGVDITRIVKTLIVEGIDGDLVALCVRGDHTLNEVKVQKLPQVKSPLTFASDARLEQAGLVKGYINPFALKTRLIDQDALRLSNFVVGANEAGKHLVGVNWDNADAGLDLRNAVQGDPSPDGKGTLLIRRGIEVGHIFQLGDKYAKALNVSVTGKDGKPQTPLMGCYGIGVSRIVAAAIEQYHDEAGITWSDTPDIKDNLAPFYAAIVPMQPTQAVIQAADALYEQLCASGVNVLLDDRDVRGGFKLADHELIGTPWRIVIGTRNLPKVEVVSRRTGQMHLVAPDEVLALLTCH